MADEELRPYLRLKQVFRELTLYRAFAEVAKLKGFQAEIEGEGILDVNGLLGRIDIYTLQPGDLLLQWSYVCKPI